MPLYEYRCRKCGLTFEKIQKFSDPPPAACEKCGGSLERLISPPAIQFKGTGWYTTDYPRKSAGSEKEKAETSPAPEGKKESASTAAEAKARTRK